MLDTSRCTRCIPGAIGALMVCAILSAQPVTFFSQTTIAVGQNPVSMAIGNFYGDRRPILAVSNRGSGTVQTLLGLGSGFFGPLASQAVGVNPGPVATGDFNRDGRPDLAVANFNSGNVAVLLGNGNGTFRPSVELSVTGPAFLLTGDFNGDGLLDLAIASQPSNAVSVYLGHGDGTFRAPFHFAVGTGPVWITSGDFNGDGRTDLLTADATSNSVSVLLGNGDGTFRAALTSDAGPTPVSIAVGDFNHDGRLDLAVVNQTSSGTVSLLLGNGTGTFRPFFQFAVGSSPSFITTADFNLDGELDLAVANTGDNTVSILLGEGNGIFQPRFDFNAGDGPAWIGVSDFDLDGKPDLAVANSRSNTVAVLVNRTFVPSQPRIADRAILNGASYQDGAVAPGEVVTIFGSNLGPSHLAGLHVTASDTVDTTLSGTRVLFDGIAAPLFYVRADQVSTIVPFSVAGQATTQVVVEHDGLQSAVLTFAVADAAPGLFTANAGGRGQGAVLNEDLSVNSPDNPAAPGSIVVLYATGAGQTDPAGVDGRLAGSVLPKPVLPVSVTIDGKKAQVLYAGAGPGLVAGVIQINARVPDEAQSGAVPVLLRVGGAVSQPGVTVSVR